MIKTVGEMIKVLQEYPETLSLRMLTPQPWNCENTAVVDGVRMDIERMPNPEGDFPVLVIKPLGLRLRSDGL